jgi:hypothetical protein
MSRGPGRQPHPPWQEACAADFAAGVSKRPKLIDTRKEQLQPIKNVCIEDGQMDLPSCRHKRNSTVGYECERAYTGQAGYRNVFRDDRGVDYYDVAAERTA